MNRNMKLVVTILMLFALNGFPKSIDADLFREIPKSVVYETDSTWSKSRRYHFAILLPETLGVEIKEEIKTVANEALVKWKLGSYEKKLEVDKVSEWLKSPTHHRRRFPDVAQCITDWVVGGMQESPYEFVRSVWRKSIKETKSW